MSTGKSILNAVRQQLNLSDYRKKHWEGTFDEYLDIVRDHPEATRLAYQRLYDMILSHGTEDVYENKEKITATNSSPSSPRSTPTAIYGLDRPLMQARQRFQVRRQGLWHRTPRAAAARTGGQLQEHHCPIDEMRDSRIM